MIARPGEVCCGSGFEIVFDPAADPDDAVTSGVIHTGAEPAPEGAFVEWRAEVIRRLLAFHDWFNEEEFGTHFFWSTEFGWQVHARQQEYGPSPGGWGWPPSNTQANTRRRASRSQRDTIGSPCPTTQP